MKNFLKKNWRLSFLLYLFIYLPWFYYIEKTITPGLSIIHIMHCSFDDLIPFCEYFIIPYLSWFLYVALACLFVLYKGSDSEFFKLALTLVIGMSLSMTICMIYPSGLHLRPVEFPRHNIFTTLVSVLYSSDTPTNVFPSVHVYNSLAIHISLSKLKVLENYKWVKNCSLILCILICLSTVFIKQHSLIDVTGAIVMMIVLYVAIYVLDYSKIFARARAKREKEVLE